MAVAAMPLSSAAIALPTLSGLVVCLNVAPMVWHFRNRNIPAFSLMFWLVLMNLINLINAPIWPNDDILNWWSGHGLCDIEIRLHFAVQFALPCTLVCIMKGLAEVLDTDRAVVNQSQSDRYKKTVFHTLMCFAMPLSASLLMYIVQPARYTIFAIAGCDMVVDASWVTVMIFWMPQILLVVAACYQAIIVIYRIYRYRKQFTRLLERTNTNKSRFIRLFAMTQILISGIFPLTIWSVLTDLIAAPWSPYSWTTIHSNWQNKYLLLPTNGAVPHERWVSIAAGILAFLFFGTGADATSKYRKLLTTLGFAHIFPSLNANTPVPSSSPSSAGSKALALFHWKKSTPSTASSGTDGTRTPTPLSPVSSLQHSPLSLGRIDEMHESSLDQRVKFSPIRFTFAEGGERGSPV